MTGGALEVLDAPVWRARRAAHEARVDAWTAPHLERARRGEKSPVEDFLFTYYSHRPARLRRWSPGAGVLLAGAGPEELGRYGVAAPRAGGPGTGGPGAGDPPGGPAVGAVLAPPPDRVLATAARVRDLLVRTAGRAPQLGCFGLHEWAMVHGQPQDAVRHSAVPLRLGSAGTTAVVDALPLRCTHIDAYRFFPDTARPLNAHQPTRETQPELEQPGCLHATMDLYKWAYLLDPWVPGELVADCFDLARRVRVLDMRASPYDLTGHGYPPVRVETAAGRAEYAAGQRAFAAEAAPLRDRLVAAVDRLLAC